MSIAGRISSAPAATASTDEHVPARLAAVFLPAPLPREGRIAFWDPDGDPLPAQDGELTVVRPHGSTVRRRTTAALTLPLTDALP
ncbi:hypothetical protein, partial [Streptomyces viridochromogenes]